MYKQAYSQLVAEGKIPGKVGALIRDKKFQARLDKFAKDAKRLTEADARPELMRLVAKNLRQLRARNPKLMSVAEMNTILANLEKVDFRAVMDQVRQPSKLQQWKEAIKQDFSNPARLGLMLGALSAPAAGITAASFGLLDNGLIMASVGSVETIVAASTVRAARLIDSWKYQKALDRQLAAANR